MRVYLDNCCFNRPYDVALKNEGMRALVTQLGPVRAERFIALLSRETFDYTEWQRDLFGDTSLQDFLHDAMNLRGKSRSDINE